MKMDGETPCKMRKVEHIDEESQMPVPVMTTNLVEKAMAIPLIADEIFRYLPNADLLRCALVNLQWNSLSRTFIRKHRVCYLAINENNDTGSMKDLQKLLEDSSHHPYNGIAVTAEISFRSKCKFPIINREDFSQVYSDILNKIYLKNLKFAWYDHPCCQAVGLLKKILQEYSSTLEFLHVQRMPHQNPTLSTIFGYHPGNRHEWLPNLKRLQLKPSLKISRTEVFEDFLSSAPNLMEIVGSVCPKNFDLIVRQNKFKTIKQFDLVRLYKMDDLSTICRLGQMQPRLTKLTVSGFRFLMETSLPMWLEALQTLWISGMYSLKEVEVNHLDLILLSQANFPPLPKVEFVTVAFDIRLVKWDGQPKLRNIDFGRLFPKLKSVRVHPDFDEPSKPKDMIVSNKLMDTDTRYACTTVTSVELINVYDEQPSRMERLDPSLHWTVILSMAKIFPRVKHFTIRGCPEVAYFCEALWTSWKELETINFTSVRCSSSFHVDPCIIGISEIEWKYWKEIKCETDFNKFQFAPIRLALRNCTKLKKFRIEFTHRKDFCRPFQLTLLTELSGACAFSRIPNLEVEVVRSKCTAEYNIEGIVHDVPCSFGLDPLAPYVKFYDYEPEEVIHPREHLCSYPY